MVVVVFPTPPFWLATAITRGSGRPVGGGRAGFGLHDGHSLVGVTFAKQGLSTTEPTATTHAEVFHVEHGEPRTSWLDAKPGAAGRRAMFHVEHHVKPTRWVMSKTRDHRCSA